MATNAPIQEQQIELSGLSEAEISTNQIVIPAANNGVARLSGSSSSDEWSLCDNDDDEKQVAKVRQQAPTESNIQVTNTYSNCTNVSSSVQTTNIYEDGVTVNNYFYCCPASIDYVVRWGRKRRKIIIVTLSVLVILLIIFLSVWLLHLRTSKSSKDVDTETTAIIPTTEEISQSTSTTIIPPVSTDSTSSSTTISTSTDFSNPNLEWRIITRDEWGAVSPNYGVDKLPILPPAYVILSETETDTCITTQKCMYIVWDIQTSALANFLEPDLVYSFLVGGDGMVYEGRGWDVYAVDMERYNTDYFDDKSISISFIGNFEDVAPTETVLQSAKTLLELGVQTGKLAEDYKLKCVRQLSHTSENPGDKLHSIIKTWKGWDNRTIDDFS